MTNFEDRILELTRSEVDRVVEEFEQLRKDAASVIKMVDKFDLQLPENFPTVFLAVDPKPGPIVRPDPERERKVQAVLVEAEQGIITPDEVMEKLAVPKPLTEKQKAFRERQKEQIRQDNEKYGKMVMNALADGPQTLVQLQERLPKIETKSRMLKTLRYLQNEGRIAHRKEKKYQGAEFWYSVDRPVTESELISEIESTPKGHELAIVRYARELGFHPKNLKKMLDEQVRLGRITKRGGLYYNERGSINPKNGRSKSRDFGGSGIAMSGDKISSSKEVNEIVRKARSLGADVRVTGGDHIQVRTEKGLVTIGKTPSGSGIKQDRERLKDIGLNV